MYKILVSEREDRVNTAYNTLLKNSKGIMKIIKFLKSNIKMLKKTIRIHVTGH